MNMPLALLNRRRRGGGFSPSALFALAEPGVWFDPSDVANLNWRVNLLTWTQEFDNAVWTKTRSSISANAAVAPDGTTTADKLVEDTTASNTHQIAGAIITLASASTNTVSVYVKAAERTWCRVANAGVVSGGAFVNLSTGQFGTIEAGVTASSIQSVGNGWYRVSVTGVLAGTSAQWAVQLSTGNGNTSYTGDGTSGILIWGAQLELGSVATTYQPITTVDAGTIERFPTATLYQDTAGTQPVTTPGQSVGLMLDKSRGLVLGPELVTNGDFSGGSTGWTLGTDWTISGGSASRGTNATASNLTGGAGVEIGKYYRVTWTQGADFVAIYLGSQLGPLISNVNAAGTYTRVVLATASGGIVFRSNLAVSLIDNISVKELPGNHAVQATTANRPIYGIHPFGGRRNLLVRTEEFENASWSKTNATVTANAGVAPDGTTTADKLINTSATSSHYVSQQDIAAGTYSWSCYMKAAEFSRGAIYLFDGGLNLNAVFDLSSGTVTSSGSAATASIASVGDGWYRCRVSGTVSPSGGGGIRISANMGGSFNESTAGNGTSGILVWGAQLETGSTATAYQRVTDQYNVTEAGVPSVSYLFFDGVNDSLATPSINFPAGPTNPTLGAELVTNGGPGFTATTSWVSRANVTVAATGGNLVGTSTNTSAMRFYVPTTTVVGRTYRVTASIAAVTGTGPSIYVYSDVGVTTITTFSTPSAGNYTFVFTATTTTSNIEFGNAANTAAGQTYSVSSVSVREIDAAYATDKMTVFAGVRKLSDASVGSFVELSAAGDSNNGAFYLRAPESAAKYSFLSRGTGNANAIYSGGLYSAPTTNVLTGIGNISGDVSTLRADGTQAATSTADQGTGTYGNYPLYIGARNSASLFFSGHLYSLIVRGAQSDTGQISSTETWVASRTGIVI
jgi:hypothetical protein